MLKKTVIVIALLIMLATTAGAAQYPALMGAAFGNISSAKGNIVAILFNASVNQKIAIITSPAYTDLAPYCTIYSLSGSSSAVSGSGNSGVAVIVPVSDVYMAYCESFNTSVNGNVWLAVYDLDKFSIIAKGNKKEPADSENEALTQLLQEQLNKLGQTQ
ncbi:secreted protein [Candidatus Magnetobacterium bavaricum]|uniref:Secreted protein n=1 Tax=Candidatus Magnetobacterium bavaricum TaxID=29290 RepID=A0A0F3GUM8_9BACT|nr:secreted protein [Candidatus Magnetobacterium bavaricum]